jgi:hypothetical protein
LGRSTSQFVDAFWLASGYRRDADGRDDARRDAQALSEDDQRHGQRLGSGRTDSGQRGRVANDDARGLTRDDPGRVGIGYRDRLPLCRERVTAEGVRDLSNRSLRPNAVACVVEWR